MINPSISIVIPVYKPREEYLRALFESIVRQTFHDFEIIISDDANAEELIRHTLPTSLKDRTLYVQNQSKKGIFGNLNNGLRHASGNCIQLFCQDDEMLPDLLIDNYSRITGDTGMAFTFFDTITEKGEVKPLQSDVIRFIPSIIKSTEANNFFLYFGCIPGNLSPVMFSKNLLLKAGFFDESYQYTGDYEYWIRAAQYTNLHFNKQKKLLIRSHDERASHSLGTLQRFFELKTILVFLINHNTLQVSKKDLQQYVHKQVFRTVILHTIKRFITFQPVNIKLFWKIFDGNPFSMQLAWKSFWSPAPVGFKSLQQQMETERS